MTEPNAGLPGSAPPTAPASPTGADNPDPEIGSDPASAAAPPSRRAALLRSGLIVAVLVVVFLIILPRYIDYQEVCGGLPGADRSARSRS